MIANWIGFIGRSYGRGAWAGTPPLAGTLLLVLLAWLTLARAMAADFTVALDIGHSPSAPGAISSRGVPEYVFNQEVAAELLAHLHRQGFAQAFILNAGQPELSLMERATIANARHADLLISIHHDSAQLRHLSQWRYNNAVRWYTDDIQGFSIFYSAWGGAPAPSERFAGILGRELLAHHFSPAMHHAEPILGENRPLKHPLRGVYQYDQLVILRNANIPAVLLECGVIVNREEEKTIRSPHARTRLAEAVLSAVRIFAGQVSH